MLLGETLLWMLSYIYVDCRAMSSLGISGTLRPEWMEEKAG